MDYHPPDRKSPTATVFLGGSGYNHHQAPYCFYRRLILFT
jgi:hypothetical protein